MTSTEYSLIMSTVHNLCTDHQFGRRLVFLAERIEILIRKRGLAMNDMSFQLLMLLLIIIVLKQK